jgi:hypothetical protein
MSVIAKGLKKAGMKMEGDVLPPEQRTVKAFKRLISAMRAVEAEVLDEKSQAERQLNESLHKNLELHEENERLRVQLLQYRLKEGLGQIDALTTNDRTKLLEMSNVA